MKIYITAKPKSKKEYIKETDNTHYIVAVNEQPVRGKANQAIIKSLSEYFKIPMSRINIIVGEKTKQKIFEVPVTEEQQETYYRQNKTS